MSDPDKTIPTAVFQSLNRGGFPLQTAITHLIRRSEGWRVLALEYPWRDSDGNENFLDIIVTKGKFILPIECKKDERDSNVSSAAGSTGRTDPQPGCC